MNRGRHPLLKLWAISTAIFFCFCAAWSWTMPIGAANDEPAQLVRAASVVRGEIVGQRMSPKLLPLIPPGDRTDFKGCVYLSTVDRCSAAATVVTVPSSFGDFSRPECFTLFVQTPAGCDPILSGADQGVRATTYVGRYPPLYYAIVGLPSLVSSTDTGVYMMRLMSGLLSSVFLGLALALTALWSRSRLLVAAVGVAVSAMVIIFSSGVNPSGLESATAICVWAGGLILVLDQSDDPRPSVVVATAVAASVMVMMRGLSPLWLAVIAVSLAALAPSSVLTLLRRTSMQVAAGVTGLVGTLSVGFILWAHSLSVYPIGAPVPATASELSMVHIFLGRSTTLVQELVGAFGWTETSPPWIVMVLWLSAASILVIVGIVTGKRGHALVVLALLVAAIVLPTSLVVSQAHEDGVVWQARDGFPLYVGILLVAGAVAFRPAQEATNRRPRLAERLAPLWCVVLAICVAGVQLGDLLWALRRYTVGLGSGINPFTDVSAEWSPPLPAVLLGVGTAAVSVLYGWWIVRLSRLGPGFPHRLIEIGEGTPGPTSETGRIDRRRGRELGTTGIRPPEGVPSQE